MTRKLALAAGVLFAAVSAGTLTAQTAAPTKPSSTGTMQHAPAALPKRQDSTTVRASTGAKRQNVAWTKDQIKEAQEGLAKAGFYKGKETGMLDRSTRKAIRKYQKANKLPVTGRLDNDLLTKLHSS
jgi:peptidoglycan hydrolase-like protein with peptidoglycan-binding domain